MTAAAIFKSRSLKMLTAGKNLRSLRKVAIEIKHTVKTLIYTSYGIKISIFLKENSVDEPEAVHMPL